MNVKMYFVFALVFFGLQANSWAQVSAPGKDWPQFGFGYNPRFSTDRDGEFKVDLRGLVNYQVLSYPRFPDKVTLVVSLEQAKAIASFMTSSQARMMPTAERLNRAMESGDSTAIATAGSDHSQVTATEKQFRATMYKELLLEIFEQEQLDTVRSLCINVTMQQLGLEEFFKRKAESLVASGMSQRDLQAIRSAIVEAEFEMQKELVRLRREAWDKVMSKLPPETVKQFEEELGFGGLDRDDK